MLKKVSVLFMSLVTWLSQFASIPVPVENPPVLGMAKIKYSGLIAGISGKLNGTVFARNAGGDYMRTKVTPVNPQSQAQVLARAKLAGFAQSWKTLTQVQRDSWSAAVANWSTTDVFGDVQNPKGNTLYTRLNINISNAGGAAIVLPPVPVGVTALTSLELAAAVGLSTFDLTFTPAAVPADHTLYVEATGPMSPGISNANAEFRTIGTVAAAGASPADLFAEYTAKFGALIEGQKVFVRAKFIHTLTGEVSQKLVASTIVAA
jgi:hypothetical protein